MWIHSSPHSLVGHTHIPAKHPLKLICSFIFMFVCVCVCVHKKFRNTESFINFTKKFGAISILVTIGQNKQTHYGKIQKQLDMHFQTTETCTLSHIKNYRKRKLWLHWKEVCCVLLMCACVCMRARTHAHAHARARAHAHTRTHTRARARVCSCMHSAHTTEKFDA